MFRVTDIIPEDLPKCSGMWCELDTQMGTEMAIYDHPVLFSPGYGRFVTDLSKATLRFDLPRAWSANGQPISKPTMRKDSTPMTPEEARHWLNEGNLPLQKQRLALETIIEMSELLDTEQESNDR